MHILPHKCVQKKSQTFPTNIRVYKTLKRSEMSFTKMSQTRSVNATILKTDMKLFQTVHLAFQHMLAIIQLNALWSLQILMIYLY